MTLKERVIKRMPTRWLGYVVYLIWPEQLNEKLVTGVSVLIGVALLAGIGIGVAIGVAIGFVFVPALIGALLLIIASTVAGYQDIVFMTWGKGHFSDNTLGIAFFAGLITLLIPYPILALKKRIVARLDKFEDEYPRRKRKQVEADD